ncbi:MAG: YceD family protein [Pyrinomonadaceae bacterium]|nr:DUF177 domain-containing protein [Blastocatellia bacterium]MDQ3491069.1 DUF177 domain-containing protein [Acidobacteriota bacterium]
MIVDLANIEGSSHPFKFSVPADDLDLGIENIRFKTAASASGEITKHIIQTDISGIISAEAEIDCTRCLLPIEKNLAIDFDVSYVAEDEFAEESNAELEAGDLNTDVLNGDRLDLKEVVREQILLNLPTQVFCREDCKGLCQKCGVNRNLIDCKCEEKEADPRWSALRNIK